MVSIDLDPGGGARGSIGARADFRMTSQSASSSYGDTPRSLIVAIQTKSGSSFPADVTIRPVNFELVRSIALCTKSTEEPHMISVLGDGLVDWDVVAIAKRYSSSVR